MPSVRIIEGTVHVLIFIIVIFQRTSTQQAQIWHCIEDPDKVVNGVTNKKSLNERAGQKTEIQAYERSKK